MIEYTVKVCPNGYKTWYLNGKKHREDGPAVEDADDYKAWYLNGKRHREDGPAIEWDKDYKAWYLNGTCHREDGPALEYADGYKEWHLNDNRVTEEEHKRRTSKVIEMTVAQISEALGKQVKVVE